MNLTFYNNSDNSVIKSFNNISNGTYSAFWNSLVPDNTYYWYASINDGSDIVNSSLFSFTTVDIDLSWTDNSENEKGFRIYNNASGSFEQIDTVGQNTESYSDSSSDLSFGSYTCYRVRSYNSFGQSEPLEECIVK